MGGEDSVKVRRLGWYYAQLDFHYSLHRRIELMITISS